MKGDVFSSGVRSQVMSRIRGRGNKKTEGELAGLMREHGITGWRRQVAVRVKDEAVKRGRVVPDFVFRHERVAVFVDGCFWHGCPQHANMPRNNRAFWKRKLEGNVARDKAVSRALKRAGWRVVRIWEHDLAKKRQARVVRRLRKALGREEE